MTVRDDVLTTAALIADNPSGDEQKIVEQLVAQGFSSLQAEILNVFVPLGLARPVIARLEANPPIRLSRTALIRDYTRDRWLEVRLADVPEFIAARKLGEETFSTGLIPREQFRAASGVSVELRLVSDALYARENLGGGKMSPPVLLRIAEAPGFEEWYRSKKLNLWRRLLPW